MSSLPMDEASRLNRAREMGFDVDNPMYHGTKSPVDQFDLRKAGKTDPGLVGRAVYGAPDGEQAGAFAMSPHYGRGDAPAVMPLYHGMRNPVIIQDGRLPDGRSLTDLHPRGITKDSAAAINKELKAAGYDGAIFKLGDEVTQYAVFDPTRVRSTQATFDPAKAKSSFLLAADQSRASVPGTLINAMDLERAKAAGGDAAKPTYRDHALAQGQEDLWAKSQISGMSEFADRMITNPDDWRRRMDAGFDFLADKSPSKYLNADNARASVPGTVLNSLDQANAATRAATGLGHLDSVPGAPERAFAPIRAYHGTENPNLKFEPYGNYEVGPHFGTVDQANSRLAYKGREEGGVPADGASVMPVDLHLRNPLDIRDPGMFDANNLPHALKATGQFSDGEIKKLSRHEAFLDDLADDAAYREATGAFHGDLAKLLKAKGYDALRYRNVSEHPEINAIMQRIGAEKNKANRSQLFAEKDAIEKRLAKEGDYSYVPMARGTVKSATTGETLFSKSDNPTGTAINALAESRKGVDAAGPRDTLNKGLTPSEHGSSAAAARNTAGWIDLYHGTGKDFDSFRTDRPAFLSDKKEIAQIYADAPSRGGNPQIKQFRAPMKNPLDVTEGDGGKGWATVVLEKFGKEPGGPKGRHQRAIDAAREAGHDMVRISDHLDLGGPQIQYVPTDASALKSAGPRDTAAAAALPERAFRDSSTRQQAKAPGAEPSTSSSLNSAEAQLPERAFGKKHPSMTQDSKAFDWSNPGGPDATGAHARTKKIGDTTVMYGVGKDGTAELISVRTPQTKRGKGSARDALVKFLEEADAMGLEVKLQSSPLDKRTHGGRLQAFYESLGFKPTGRTINPVGDPEMIRAAKRDNLPERAFKD
jgi:hypothetical protein